MEFSLLFYSSDEQRPGEDCYRMTVECAKFADQHGFSAVWIPERHFNKFGGLFPDPAILAAALAKITERIQLRANNLLLPLHHPARIAEQWAMVDNLSKGRVGLSFAPGFHHQDYVFAPENFGDRKKILYSNIEMLKQLWEGGHVSFSDGLNNSMDVKIFPKPVQPKFPLWIAGRAVDDAYLKAGELGAKMVTALLNINVDQLAEKLSIYRNSLAKNHHERRSDHVAVILHTYVGASLEAVKEKSRIPFKNYIQSFAELAEPLAESFKVNTKSLSAVDRDYFLDFVYERYFKTSALIGTPESCLTMIDRLKAIGVNEVVCLIDFGIDYESVREGLFYLKKLKELANAGV
jgi:natural product biosynthesis luciferase-like monooxygenase protein